MSLAVLFDDLNQVIYKSQIETKYKVEEIINYFNNVPSFSSIKEIYINIEPGSFTGSRIALLYVRTLAQIKDIKIFTTSTFELLSKQNSNFFRKKFYIFATKNKSYLLTKNKIAIIDKSKKETKINYELILNNFGDYQFIFKEQKISDIKPIYASEPQIGKIN